MHIVVFSRYMLWCTGVSFFFFFFSTCLILCFTCLILNAIQQYDTKENKNLTGFKNLKPIETKFKPEHVINTNTNINL